MISFNLSEKITPQFHDFYRALKDDKYQFYFLKGGRGSGKSDTVAKSIIVDIIRYDVSWVCIMSTETKMRTTIFEQVKDAIKQLGLTKYFKFTTRPLEMIYKPKGNKIYFKGAMNPEDIKGIKAAEFPIRGYWVEETASFRTEESLSIIKNSVVRGELPNGLTYKGIHSYNPPKNKQHWLNKKYNSVTIPENTYVHHSTYLGNPYLSYEFLREAEIIKELYPKAYEWEYMGAAIGAGLSPFNNLIFREISDDDIARFDNVRHGIDWGYSVDPLHLTRLHYDKTKRRLYIFGEIHGIKIGMRELSEKIISRKWNNTNTLTDNSKANVDLLKEHGITMIDMAKKGPGSVEAGETWLDELDAIIIDPKRCPNTAREFESIDYAIDKNGNIMTRLIDKDNHSIDAVRYACEPFMAKSREIRGYSY